MKYSFYCLPLRKHVKAKITAIVKKKSYSVKGIHKEGGKEYNLNKVIGKAEAERISKETGIDIDEGQMVAAAEEFLPEGSGHVIGQNTAGVETAIDGTEETVTANTTPFRSESPDPTDDDDNIGPMSMASEESDSSCACGCSTGSCKCPPGCKCGCTDIATGETHNAEMDSAGNPIVETVEEVPLESTSYESYLVSEEHWEMIHQHPDWDDEITEMVHLYRNSEGVVIQVPYPFADEVLEIVAATQDMPMDALFQSEEPTTGSSLLGLGIGIVGLAAAFALYRRFGKEE